MEMADSSYCENDLDEEKARRSILVTNVPGNLTNKDVIIHFQKPSNGGGEVECGIYHDPENRSSVVITFEDPSTVETAIGRRQVLGKTEVTVQRHPVGIRIPEVFSDVNARLNPEILDLLPSMERALHDLNHEHGIRCWKTARYIIISGSYKQIASCHKYIRDEIANNKSKGHGLSRPLHGHVAAAGATRDAVHVTPRDQGKSDEIEENYGDKEIDSKTFQSVPIILDFIFSVPKYSKMIETIESEFNVKIRGVEEGNKVVITPLPGCTQEKHDDACEEYIKLYREVYDGPMMSKDVVLKPGKDSFYSSAEEAVKEVLKEAPVAIQNIEEPDKWLFYGEEANVRSAVKAVCKKLGIGQTPFRKTRKAVVYQALPEEEEKRSGTTSSTHVTLEDKAKGNPLTENFHELSSPNHNDLSADKEWPFEVKTKKGFRLQVYEGDITKERVDVIVNSADEFLDFWTGLPAALVKRGGRDIQIEAEAKQRRQKTEPGDIIITGPGNLHCSKIAHILTKNYPSSKREECKKAVKDGCLKCLKCTQRNKLKSISFPAVGSGQQGMPIDKCAAAVISAVEEYMAASDPKIGAVTDIRFVHCDPSAVKVFQAELKKRYGDSIVKPTKDPSTQGKNETSSDKRGGPPAEKKTAKKENEEDDVCPICLDGFHDPRILTKCNHKFCKLCIDQAFQHRKVCPTCGMAYGVQTGNMPPGTMNHFMESYTSLSGYEKYGTIRIDYHIPSGTQGPEHPNPGQWYSGTSRSAYLPDCPEGREVLHLLKKAFDARLTFTIGRSVTTGISNVVTWNDIHHKTNPHGGATGYGYPDPTYLKRVKAELAAKGIS